MVHFNYLLLITILVAMRVNSDELRIKKTEFVEAEVPTHQLCVDLAQKPIVHLKTLALQKDNFSCGYHALFNAVAIDKSVQFSYGLSEQLKKNLSDKNLFAHVYNTVQQYVKQDKPLDGSEISQIASNLNLGSRLIPLFYTDKQELMIPALYAFVEHPITMPKHEIEQLLHEKRKTIVHQKISDLMLTTCRNPNQVGHFVCNIGDHWILYSLISDYYQNIRLYIIGSHNEPINDVVKKYAYELLGHFEQAGIRGF